MEETSPIPPLSGSQCESQLGDLIYLPKLTEWTLDDNLPAFGPPLNNGGRSKASLGALERVPLELLQMVICQLDLRTLTNFRYVNHRAMGVVDSVHQYKMIVTHAPNVLRGILIVGTGQWITCETVYEKLCTAECEECGDFGGYLYIITCKRVCFLCFTKDKRYLPLSRERVMRDFGITRQIVTRLPYMRSLQGIYLLSRKTVRKRFILVDYESARTAGILFHGSPSVAEQYASDMAAQKLKEYEQKVSSWLTDRSTARMPRTSEVYDEGSWNLKRFVAIVRAPFINGTKSLEWGFQCIGCKGSIRSRSLHYARKFSVESFSEHLKECGNIQDGKHHPS